MMKRTSKIIYCILAALLMAKISLAQTPIDQVGAGPHLFFDAKNIVVTNGATPTIKFDIYMSASQMYIDYLAANDAKYALESVDVAYDVDFGTDGTNGNVTVLSNSALIVNSQLANIQAPKTVLGNSPAYYDTKFKYTLYRVINSSPLTTAPTHVVTATVTFDAGVVIGTVANGAKIQLRCAATGFGTGLQGSKWGDLSGENNNQNIIGAVNPRTQPLPVTLKSFNASKEGTGVNVTWATTEETNSDRFDVQRSADGKEWSTIETLAAKGESKAEVAYSTVDNDPFEGDNFYRLHMIDKDGTSAHSRIVNVRFEGIATYLYPNPVSDQLTIKAANWNKVASVRIVNADGREVYKSAGKPSPTVDVKSMDSGIYLVHLVNDNGSESTYKILVSK